MRASLRSGISGALESLPRPPPADEESRPRPPQVRVPSRSGISGALESLPRPAPADEESQPRLSSWALRLLLGWSDGTPWPMLPFNDSNSPSPSKSAI